VQEIVDHDVTERLLRIEFMRMDIFHAQQAFHIDGLHRSDCF
jgi:hypothetical protein